MTRLEKTIVINSPIEHVFRFLQQPENLPRFWPAVCAVHEVHKTPSGGKRFHWQYKMVGVRFEGTGEYVDHKFGQYLIGRSRGGIEATVTWLTEPVGGAATSVTVKIEYKVPPPLLGRLREEAIASQNDREADLMMENLKLIVEHFEAEQA